MKIIFLIIMLLSLSGCSSCSKSGRKNLMRKAHPINIQADEKPENNIQKSGSLTIVEISKLAEPCVFMIYSLDSYGNALSQGTGFFVHSQGVGVSNYHVLEGGNQWVVKTIDGKTFNIERILSGSKTYDYIIFQIKFSGDVPFLPISLRIPQKGEEVVVLGNPEGLESTLTKGIVSSIRSVNSQYDVIQIDASITHGSSGSPVINMKGEVIGIATSGYNGSDLNFALNINVIDFEKILQ